MYECVAQKLGTHLREKFQKQKTKIAVAGDRTRVVRVTGGNTYHYTTTTLVNTLYFLFIIIFIFFFPQFKLFIPFIFLKHKIPSGNNMVNTI
jgi:hypothetical protein